MNRLVVLAIVLCQPVFAADEVTPAHVYQAVDRLAREIVLIRAISGAPQLEAKPWVVRAAQPRHVYYQAQTLFRKSNRLAGEVAGVERSVEWFLELDETAAGRAERIGEEVAAILGNPHAQEVETTVTGRGGEGR